MTLATEPSSRYSIVNSPALPPRARSLIESLENELLLSIASVWEMAIMVEGLPPISGDTVFDQYPVQRLW